MKTLFLFHLGACLCVRGVALAQSVGPPFPEPGRWEMRVSLRGAPVKDPALSTVCLRAQDLGDVPERAFLEAAVRSLPQESKGEPQCKLTEVLRDDEKSSWQARCNGPRGPMHGAGKAVLSPQAATVEQGFGVDTPFGRQTLTQTIRARRLGNCP